MKTTHTLTQFFPSVHAQLMAWQLDAERNPVMWHDQLQKCLVQGAFLKMEFGFSLAGKVDARIVLVDAKTGRGTQITSGEVFHA